MGKESKLKAENILNECKKMPINMDFTIPIKNE
jgi:hypothetical protein